MPSISGHLLLFGQRGGWHLTVLATIVGNVMLIIQLHTTQAGQGASLCSTGRHISCQIYSGHMDRDPLLKENGSAAVWAPWGGTHMHIGLAISILWHHRSEGSGDLLGIVRHFSITPPPSLEEAPPCLSTGTQCDCCFSDHSFFGQKLSRTRLRADCRGKQGLCHVLDESSCS